MSPLKIAISFLKVPRIFASLILFPLILSIIVLLTQLFVTHLFVEASTKDSAGYQQTSESYNSKSITRKIIYGTYDPLPKLLICRWKESLQGNALVEAPPSDECAPDRLDVAIITDHPESYDPGKFLPALEGNFERLHICKNCHPDILIYGDSPTLITETKSVFALMLIHMAEFNDQVVAQYVKARSTHQNAKDLFGKVKLQMPGFRRPIPISGAVYYLASIVNIAVIITIALWLSLKAHRKVLDYFSSSGSLVPFVAATGSRNFYSALWIITFVRVGAFLLASLPFAAISFIHFSDENPDLKLFEGNLFEILIWLVTLTTSLGLATLLASIADLKRRHSLTTWVYRYTPLVLCFSGAFFWAIFFLFERTQFLREILVSLPILGSLPILLAPLVQPRVDVLCLHLFLSLLLLVMVVRYNVRWFAVHVEEL